MMRRPGQQREVAGQRGHYAAGFLIVAGVERVVFGSRLPEQHELDIALLGQGLQAL